MHPGQREGLLGRAVDAMVRRSVRKSFHHVDWIPPGPLPDGPAIFVANHHGWHDGYLMYLAITALDRRVLDWIQAYDSFPLFGRIGGMPFPAHDAAVRAATIRRTVRLMRDEGRSLMLFAEGVLHRPPELLPFGKSLELVAGKTGATVVPVGIRYELSTHERPEAILSFGPPVEAGPDLSPRTRLAVAAELDRAAALLARSDAPLPRLLSGTPDVNERWDAVRAKARP